MKNILKKKSYRRIFGVVIIMAFFMIINGNTSNAATSGDYTYEVLSDGTAKITAYNGKGKTETVFMDLNIPELIDNKIVSAIGDNAFKDCPGIQGKITLPDSLITIGNSAFANCGGLNSGLTIPDSVTSIGESAFYGCRGFADKLVLGKNLVTIGNSAFYNCDGFSGDFAIPDKVTSIGDKAFNLCEFIGNSGKFTIGSSVKTIGSEAFSGCTRISTNLIIPNSVTKIGDNAFNGCTAIKSLTIGTGVTTIGANAFNNCTGMTGNLTIPNNVTSLGTKAFYQCKGFMGNLTIGTGITKIEESTFQECTGLTGNLVIPDSVTKIGNHAFATCSGFNGIITIGSKVTTIDHNAFKECSRLNGDLIIPDSVTTIGADAFRKCTALNGKLNIGTGVTTIGDRAFYNCGTLSGETIMRSALKQLDSDVFYGCASLTRIVFISTPPTIKTDTFTGFANKVYYPNGVTGYDESKGFPTGRTIAYYIKAADVANPITSVEKIYLNASVSPEEMNRTLKYTISDSSVATIDSSSGVITPLKSGNTIVKIATTDETNISKDIIVNVKILGGSVALNQSDYTFNTKTAYKLVATVTPSAASQTVTWASSDTNIATVDSNGNVTPVKNGNCQITATTKDGTNISAKCNITVEFKELTLNSSKVNLTYTDDYYNTYQLKATINSSSTSADVTWTSSNSKVATVDTNGVVTPVGVGTAVVTATTKDGLNLKAQSTITVETLTISTGATINLTPTSYTFTTKDTLQLKTEKVEITQEPTYGWSSSNENVAKVSSQGVVTPQNNGTAVITLKATIKNDLYTSVYTKTSNITVNFKTLSLNSSTVKLTYMSDYYNMYQLKASISNSTTAPEVTWTSSNTKVATVDSNGIVKAEGTGTCTITATTKDGDNLNAQASVTVDGTISTGATINLTPATYTCTSKDTLQLKTEKVGITQEPTYEWSSSNENVAKVSNQGLVTPQSNGTAVITLKATIKSDLYTSVYTKISTITVTINKPGDVNGDTVTDTKDINKMLQYLIGKITDTTEKQKIQNYGDVNNDKVIDTKDVNKMLKYITGKISSL